MNDNIIKYFIDLTEYSQSLISKLPIEKTPQKLEYSLSLLDPYLEKIKEDEIKIIKNNYAKPYHVYQKQENIGIGLNTVGMLIDRLTILIMKERVLRNKHNNNQKADEIYQKHIVDIFHAIEKTNPGVSAENTKVTGIKTGMKASSWEEAFYGLLRANIVLRESQEMLYIKDIANESYEELQAYIKWFSYGNMMRNELIQLCEEFYWSDNK